MKQDLIMTIMGVLFGFCGVIEISGGKLIIGGALIAFGAVCIYMRGSGKANQRSQYEKVVKCNGHTIEDLFNRIKTVNTPLGKAWIAEHEGFAGESIVFGPNKFSDMVVISYDPKKKAYNMRHINKLANVRVIDDADEKRFAHCLDLANESVTPKLYAEFAANKIASVTLLNYLMDEAKKLVAGSDEKPAKIGKFKVYQCNSSDDYLRDLKGAIYMELIGKYRPFTAKTYDGDGEKLTSIVPRAINRKNQVIDSRGFDMYADDEHYAEIAHKAINGHDGFTVDAGEDKFVVEGFPAVQRGNLKSNYYVYKDGELKAIIAGIPNIEFVGIGKCRQYVIMSYDDDYLVLYASLINFITTLNNFLK